MKIIMKKNRYSIDFCIPLVQKIVFMAVLLLIISDVDLPDIRTEKVGRKMSLAQLCTTCVSHVTRGSNCHRSAPIAVSLLSK